jgi:hypothetical protein
MRNAIPPINANNESAIMMMSTVLKGCQVESSPGWSAKKLASSLQLRVFANLEMLLISMEIIMNRMPLACL